MSIALHPAARSEVCRDFCTSELMADLCHDLIGPDARLYWDQSVYKRPHGAEPVLWHQDNGYTYIEPQAYLTVWVALTDATPENGCVEVLPGVHRSGTVAHREHADRVRVLSRPRRRGRGAGTRRRGRRVLVAHPARHRPQHHRRRSGAAYIVQYAPEGAECLRGDPDAGPPVARDPQDAPERQFPVLVDGERPAL